MYFTPSPREVLDILADRVGKPGLSFEAYCEDRDVTRAVLREITAMLNIT